MKSRLSYNNYLVQPWCNVHGNNGSIGNYRLQTFQIHYNITLDGNNGSIGKEDVKLWNRKRWFESTSRGLDKPPYLEVFWLEEAGVNT